jgi:RHS repeat-associated protein
MTRKTTPAAFLDSAGNVLERCEYDAYSQPTIRNAQYAIRDTSLYDNPYLFTGRRVDILDNGSLKIQYNRNRYYDYYTGRWLTHDPAAINPDGGKQNPFSILRQYAFSPNLYEYANSNPLKYIDMYGTSAVDCGVTWHRLPAGVISLFPPIISFGHEWIEYPGASMGFWPTGSVWGSDGSVLRPDPHAGDYSGTNWLTVKSESCWRDLKYGSGKGVKCLCATCAEVMDCLKHIAIKWDADNDFSVVFQNCRHFRRRALLKCCLNTSSSF